MRASLDGQSYDLTTFKNDNGPVTQIELDAIRKYTSDNAPATYRSCDGSSKTLLNDSRQVAKYWDVLNSALRGQYGSESKCIRDYYDGVIKNTASVINKSRSGPCNFWRFLDANKRNLASQLSRKGQTFIDPGFMSTTANNYPPQGFENKPHVIAGYSANCPKISRYSSIPSEAEILFPPGSEFRVTRNQNGNTFYLEEIDPGTPKSSGSNYAAAGEEGPDESYSSAASSGSSGGGGGPYVCIGAVGDNKYGGFSNNSKDDCKSDYLRSCRNCQLECMEQGRCIVRANNRYNRNQYICGAGNTDASAESNALKKCKARYPQGCLTMGAFCF